MARNTSFEGWEDAPRGTWGDTYIFAEGVLQLARWYEIPYVRCGESHALLQHWEYLEAAAEARRRQGWDEERFQREWPEEARLRAMERAEFEQQHERLWDDVDEEGD